jgi:hypothetical protein
MMMITDRPQKTMLVPRPSRKPARGRIDRERSANGGPVKVPPFAQQSAQRREISWKNKDNS